jgi:Flp pilus assembly protein TadD
MRTLSPLILLAASVALGATVTTASPLAAQDALLTIDGKLPARPKLPAGADTNDARAYDAYGDDRETPWKKSFDAYYWAYRLDPANEFYRAKMSDAVLYSMSPEWRFAYLYEGAGYAVKSKEAKLIDTLGTLSFRRDPLAHAYVTECRGDAEVMRVKNPLVAGDYFYRVGCYSQAAIKYDSVVAKRPEWLDVRVRLARVLTYTGRHGAAIEQVQATLDSLRARQTKHTSRYIFSQEVLELMRGEMLVASEDYFNAKKAFARSLEENLAYGPAHTRLARVALVQGELAEAIQEYDMALQIDEKDPVAHNDLGIALMQAERLDEAVPHFRRAIELEPHFSLPYFNLALAIDKLGKDKEGAVTAWRDYLARAPKRQGRQINQANGRLAALGQTAGRQ